jgi:PAS domain S-box-containing protein
LLDIYQEYSNHIEEIFKNTQDYIYLHDEKGNIINVNDVILRNFGYSKEEFLRMKVTDFLVEEGISNDISEINETTRTGIDNKPKTYKGIKKNGDFVYLEATTIPLKRNGEIYANLSIGNDVTVYKKVEQSLVLSEKKYRHLFKQSPFSISLFDQDGNLIESNGILVQKMASYVGLDFTGQNFIEIASHFQNSKQVIQIFSERFKALRQGEDLDPIEFNIITMSGEKLWLNWRSSRFEIDNQSYIQVIIQDITERKLSEKKARSSKKSFQVLFNNSTSGIAYHKVIYDQNQNPINYILTDVNPKYEEILQLKREDVINKNSNEVYQVDHAPYLDVFSGVAETGETTSFETYFSPLDKYFSISVISPKRGEFISVFDDITERKKAENKLKESEEKFRSIAEYSDAEISIIQDGIFKYINQKALDTIGYTTEEINLWKPNELFEKIVHPTQRESALRLTERIQSGDKDYQFHDEIQFLNKLGNIVWLDSYSRSITFQGRPALLNCSLDITSKKEAEDSLKESEKILKDFIYNATDSISIWDANLNLIEINDIAADPWSSPNEPERGISMLKLAPSITETDRYKKYLEVIKTGIPVAFNNVEIPPKVGERYFDIKAFKVGEGLGIIGTEITEHIRFEQELKESEEKFRTIAEQSFMGIVIIQEGKIEYMNKVLVKMSEFPIDEMLKQPTSLIAKMVHPDDLNYILQRLQSNTEGTMSELSQNSFRIITSSGEVRWLEDYTSKIIYKGKPANLISVVDVTDKKKAEQLIIEENKRLLELEDLRKDLITRVSHELKTPLTSIFGSLQILLSIFREKMNKDTLKYVNIGYSGCLRLKELIENLLDSSRLESKKLELKLQIEDLALLIRDCVNDMSYLADLRKQSIDINTPYRVNFEVDRLRFRQVITNIISNAIKNSPREGKVFINLSEEDKYIDIQVKDSGIGITEKEQGILFEKFGKIERYGMDLDVDIEGSGLGLYISKEIVELHGGQILVESEGRNKGSTFTVRLYKN